MYSEIFSFVATDDMIIRANNNLDKVILYYEYPFRLDGVVYSTNNEGEIHPCSIDIDGNTFCGCIAFKYGKKICVHIIMVLLKIMEREQNIETVKPFIKSYIEKNIMGKEVKSMDMPRMIKTRSTGWNTFIGGIPTQLLTGLCGLPQVNKTVLLQQLMFETLAKDDSSSAILLDTEGGLILSLLGWKEIFERVYGIKRELVVGAVVLSQVRNKKAWSVELQPNDTNNPAIYCIDARNITNITALHGLPIKLNPSEQGRLGVRLDIEGNEIPQVQDTLIGSICKDKNVKFLGYDSVTAPSNIFISGQLNFPNRDDAMGLWMIQAQNLSSTFDMPVIGTLHLTQNEANQFDTGKAEGGKSIHHNFKFLIRIDRFRNPRTGNPAQSPNLIDKRKILRERHPFKPTGRRMGYVTYEIGDDGLKDVEIAVSERELENE